MNSDLSTGKAAGREETDGQRQTEEDMKTSHAPERGVTLAQDIWPDQEARVETEKKSPTNKAGKEEEQNLKKEEDRTHKGGAEASQKMSTPTEVAASQETEEIRSKEQPPPEAIMMATHLRKKKNLQPEKEDPADGPRKKEGEEAEREQEKQERSPVSWQLHASKLQMVREERKRLILITQNSAAQ